MIITLNNHGTKNNNLQKKMRRHLVGDFKTKKIDVKGLFFSALNGLLFNVPFFLIYNMGLGRQNLTLMHLRSLISAFVILSP